MCLIPRIAIIAPSTRICQCCQGFLFIFRVRGMQMLPIQMLCTVGLPCTSDSSFFLVIVLVVITEKALSRGKKAVRLCDHVISCFLFCNQHKGTWWHSLLPNSAPLLAWSLMLQTNCKTTEIKYLNSNSQKLETKIIPAIILKRIKKFWKE